eukprot:CAMPEP_0167740088 /NCGR_PEP_ID=MMETSP0110_2-20121227/79_1 /TAXON_ID=629695 /ORGANISM="Gymnochlora sp., Strain CCMP2014" /LENGTH=499 /DNA_ID=CAMNT_0007623935 /DNA_START=120 /DNA_END=1616 /DNA_ORIENTATION=+
MPSLRSQKRFTSLRRHSMSVFTSFENLLDPSVVNHAISIANRGNKTSFLRVHKKLSVVTNDVWSSVRRIASSESLENQHVCAWQAPNSSYQFLAEGSTWDATLSTENRFEQAKTMLRDLKDRVIDVGSEKFQDIPLVCAGFSFSSSNARRVSGPWRGYPDGKIWLPSTMIYRSITTDVPTAFVTVPIHPGDSPASVRMNLKTLIEELMKRIDLESEQVQDHSKIDFLSSETVSKFVWEDMINKTVTEMRKNNSDLSKVVLARCHEEKADTDIHIGATLENLRKAYPDCHIFMLTHPNSSTFLGASPESLVRLEGSHIYTTALAGTMGRGLTASEDEGIKRKLRSSQKNLHEHALVVSAIRSQLENVSSSIRMPASPIVRTLRNVHHLETPIFAKISNEYLHDEGDIFDIISRLHPTPAMGGWPRSNALKWMQDIEGMDRGWYASPIGWINRDGDCGEFIVAIRSAVVERETVWIYAGCGIVAASTPESEWQETLVKLQA